jgi:hypothetical protein
MQSALKGKDLYEFIIAEKMVSPEEKVKNEQAKTLMYSAMTASQIASTGVCESARDLWVKIKENHEGASSSQRSVAFTQFLKLRYHKNESINDFAGRFETALGRLEATGFEVDNDLKKHVFSDTLPDYMKRTVQLFKMSKPSGTVADLISQLKINHHQENKQDEQTGAFYAQGGRPHMGRTNQYKGSNYKGNKPAVDVRNLESCDFCKIRGHHWKDCRKLKSQNAGKYRFGQPSYNAQRYNTQSNNRQPYKPPGQYSQSGQGYKPPGQSRPPYQQKPNQNRGASGYKSKPLGQSGAFMADHSSLSNDTTTWIVDSGASKHMTPHRYLLKNYVQFEEPEHITIGNGKRLDALGQGDIKFNTGEFTGTLTNVIWVPDLRANLFSVAKTMELGCSVEFSQEKSEVYFYRENELVLSGTKKDESNYFLIEMITNEEDTCLGEHAFLGASMTDWHKRLAHCSMDMVKALAKSEAVKGMRIENTLRHECEACIMGKLCRAHHPERPKIKATENSAVLHIDTVGPIRTISLGNARYFILATEEYSGYYYFDTLSTKDLIPEAVKIIINKTELESGRPVKQITTDGGTEYNNNNLNTWLKKRGIIHDVSVAYTPEQNGRAERANRTILNAMRTILFEAKLDGSLWGEALNTVVYTLNRVPSSKNPDKTRYELLRNEKPDISNLRIFGQPVIFKADMGEGKLYQRGMKGVFVGYTNRFNTYRILADQEHEVVETCDVKFLTPQQIKAATTTEPREEVVITLDGPLTFEENGDDTLIDQNNTMDQSFVSAEDNESLRVEEPSDNIPVRARGEALNGFFTPTTGRQTRSSSNMKDVHIADLYKRANVHLKNARSQPFDTADVALFTLDDEPMTVEDARSRKDWPLWRKAMEEELDALNKNETWVLVDKPAGVKTIKNKWVFKVKLTHTGEIERYKARLVAKGFTQIQNVDYKETYAPVAGMNVIRLFLAIATRHQMKIIQFDIKTAFLHGDLEETIYMDYPAGCPNPNNKVCKLTKSLYGLKQAPRNWNSKFNEFLEKFNLTRSDTDKCLYYNDDKSLLLVIYVDDALVASRNETLMKKLIQHLESTFELKTMECKMFLGIEIDYEIDKRQITLSQPNYISKVLERFNMTECNPASTPEQVGVISKNDELLTPDYPFKELVGSLLYLVTCTRPDIAHAVSMASRTSAPTQAHWLALKQILRYLKGTKQLGIRFRWEETNELIGYSDADYANDESRKSNTGYCVFYGGGPIAWRCQRQPIITLSTTEAEYVAGCDLVKEIIPIRDQLIELGEMSKDQPARILIDNQSAIKIATNESAQQRTKHIDIRDKWLTEQAMNKKITVNHIRGEEQVADILTKPLHKTKFAYNRSKLLTAMFAMAVIIFTMVPINAQRTLRQVDDTILLKSDYVIVNEDNRNVVKLTFVNPCEIFFNHTGSAKITEKFINTCYEYFSKKHLGPHKYCKPLNTIGPDLTFVPENYNCAYDSEANNNKDCIVTRKTGVIDTERHLSIIQEEWNKHRKKVDDIPMLIRSERKRRFPLLVPLIGLWAGVISGASLKSFNMGKVNAQDIETVINVTNQHTEILKSSVTHYEVVRNEILAISEWINTADDLIHGSSNIGKRAELVKNYTKQCDQNEAIIKEIMSAASVKKVPSTLARMEFDQAKQAVNKSNLYECYYGLEDKNAVIYLDFSMPKIDEQSEVLAVYPMEHYVTRPGPNNSDTRYCYATYTGPKHILYNKTTDCMTGLQENKVFDNTVRAQTCLTKNAKTDNPLDSWRITECSTTKPTPDESRVIIHMVDGIHKIYCFPFTITIEDGPEQPCPMSSFILESYAKFTIGNIRHIGNLYDTNITRKTRSVKHNNETYTIYSSLDDDFDQVCESNPDLDNRGNPHKTIVIELGSPDNDPDKGRRFKRSPIAPPSISNSISVPTLIRTGSTDETTERPRIRAGETLRELSKSMNFSLDAIKAGVQNLPGKLNFTRPDFDTIIDLPINALNDGYHWIIAHLKSISSLVGFMTGCMIFVMIMPLVELIFFGIKFIKVPLSLWISSAKRATRRVIELKEEISVSNPFKSHNDKWDTKGKYV